MELHNIDNGTVTLSLNPQDAALLAQLCQLAEAHIYDDPAPEMQALTHQAEVMASLFQLVALGGAAVGYLPPNEAPSLKQEMAGLDLAGILQIPS